MSNKTIKNIVFDMGNVLFPYRPRMFIEKFTSDESIIEYMLAHIFHAPEWEMFDEGLINLEEGWQKMAARISDEQYPLAEKIFNNWYNYVVPYDDMEELVKELKTNGYGIYLLSNTCENFYYFCEKMTALSLFDGISLSYKLGYKKPDENIYKAFFAEQKLVAEECFFIDDMPCNIEAGEQLGMRGFVYKENIADLRQNLRVHGVIISND